MTTDAATYKEYENEDVDTRSDRKLDFQRAKPKSLRHKSHRRQSVSRKVPCGIGARRNKRWAW